MADSDYLTLSQKRRAFGIFGQTSCPWWKKNGREDCLSPQSMMSNLPSMFQRPVVFPSRLSAPVNWEIATAQLSTVPSG